jgi:anthranilate phosphoribosyltransferase
MPGGYGLDQGKRNYGIAAQALSGVGSAVSPGINFNQIRERFTGELFAAMIKSLTGIIEQGKDLSSAQMETAMEEIMTGNAQTPEIAAFLTGLAKKGETVEELASAATVMRRHVVRIDALKAPVLDTCGTGGDNKGTFNVSTAVAFVASGCGITVAKHGNRSVSSACGSADILEALGIVIDLPKEAIEKSLNEIGVAFLFAPNFHPAMKYAMPARKQVNRRTIFNLLGPLTNPAAATHQLLGVYDAGLTTKLSRVLLELGTVHSLVVHGEDGLDEITITAPTLISEVNHGKITNYKILPEDFGFKRSSLKDLAGGKAADNSRILLEVLNAKPSPFLDAVLLNSAWAVYAADRAASVKEALKLAEDCIASGKALEKLNLLKRYNTKAYEKN